jgi:hypothetical protein
VFFACCHRSRISVIDNNEVRAYFGLVGEDGSNTYFQCDHGTLQGLLINIGGLSEQAKGIADNQGIKSASIPFETGMAFVGVCQGGNAAGNLIFGFATLTGGVLTTSIKPEVAAGFASNLKEALASLARPPKINDYPISGGNIAGDEHSGETVEYFGQHYEPKILQAFGILMIRANLLDRCLITLLAAISSLTFAQSEAAYYSNVNNAARIELVRAISKHSALPDPLKTHIEKNLDKAYEVSRRRNDLVHSVWSYDKDRFTLSNYSAKKKGAGPVVMTTKSILDIAETYRSIGFVSQTLAATVLAHMPNIARNAASTPSSGSPSS